MVEGPLGDRRASRRQPEIRARIRLARRRRSTATSSRIRSRCRAVQRSPRPTPRLPRGLRAHQQGADPAEEQDGSSGACTARCSSASRARATSTSSTRCGNGWSDLPRIVLQNAGVWRSSRSWMASTSKPGDVVIDLIPWRVARGERAWDDAIAEQRVLLEQDALNDRCLQGALPPVPPAVVLRRGLVPGGGPGVPAKADPEENRFYEDYRPQGMLAVKGRLGNELWVKARLPPGREPVRLEDL